MARGQKILILNDTSISLHIGCELVVNNLIKEIIKRGHIIIKTFPVSLSEKDVPIVKKYIEDSDIVIINGEGTIHDGQGEYLLKLGACAKNKQKRVYLINAVYQNNPIHFREYLKKFDKILVRESKSYDELEKINIESAIAPDLTLITDITNIKTPSKRKELSYSDSVLPDINQYLNSIFSKKNIFIPPFLKINYKNIKNIFSRKLILLSDTTFKKLIKYSSVWFKNLFSKNKHIFSNSEEYIKEISKSKQIVAGRFHTMCLCLLTKTPFVAIESNTHKISGVLKDIGNMENRIVPIEKITNETKISKFSEIQNKNIKKYLLETKEKWGSFFDSI